VFGVIDPVFVLLVAMGVQRGISFFRFEKTGFALNIFG
jgi:hypothetical protein